MSLQKVPWCDLKENLNFEFCCRFRIDKPTIFSNSEFVYQIKNLTKKIIVGQEYLIERLLLGLLTDKSQGRLRTITICP